VPQGLRLSLSSVNRTVLKRTSAPLATSGRRVFEWGVRDAAAAGHGDHADGRKMHDMLRVVACPAGEVKRGVRVRAYQELFGDHTMSR
jgi:hypothetical protein